MHGDNPSFIYNYDDNKSVSKTIQMYNNLDQQSINNQSNITPRINLLS